MRPPPLASSICFLANKCDVTSHIAELVSVTKEGFAMGNAKMQSRRSIERPGARLHIWHTAWLLDSGDKANFESSRAKVVCSEAEWRVVDRCVQILGGQGVTTETIVMRIFTDMRAFRIYDGPSEVHRWSLARKIVSAGGQPT